MVVVYYINYILYMCCLIATLQVVLIYTECMHNYV